MASRKKGRGGNLSLSGSTPRGLKSSTGTKAPKPRGQTTRSVERAAPVVGRPGIKQLAQRFPRVLKPVWPRGGIKTLIKRDLSKGITQPEAATLPGQVGVVGPGQGGYKGATVMHQQPTVSPTTGKNQRVVAAPSPTSGAGVRSPFNAKRRVGKRASSKRFGG